MAGGRAAVLVVGGGLGGVAAALTAAEAGCSVILTEETDWLGGQLTAQAVPPDEHPLIERAGCTARYRRLRDGIRDHYRAWYPLTDTARARPHLNPGLAAVSPLAHEPRVALAVIDTMLAPHRAAGRLRVLDHHAPAAADVDGDRVRAVALADLREGGERVVTADWVVDATETGELLAQAGVEHVTGFESREETGEPHAPARAQPLNMQPVTACFALDHLPGRDHTVERPPDYGRWRDRLSWVAPDPVTLRPVTRGFTPNPDDEPAGDTADTGDRELWRYRRIAARRNFTPGAYPSDVTLVNWPQSDYTGGPIYGVPADEAARHVEGARRLALGLLYWLQTGAAREDGGAGYPGLRLRGDVVGTPDGLAKTPYVRESRRIRAEHTVVEHDLSRHVRGDHGAVRYPDAVGTGHYRIDLHPSTGGDPYVDLATCPFELPLGALVPVRLDNLLPGAKNIGTTHVTNGCYRVHPVEWNVGEVAGRLAAFCAANRAVPRQVRARPALLERFQATLAREGVQLRW
ncbi:MAG: FAD-dependent oxidoreductase [Actinomycetota bacterium]|nr:FAD-dependent oxidoreductase [Actinomycetota bacterium]